MLCVFLSQRNTAAKQPKLHGISTNRRTRVLDLGTLDQPENHQALHLRIVGIDRVDDALLASFQRCECVAVDFHNFL